MITTLNKLGQKNFLNVIKGIYQNPQLTSYLTDEKLKAFALQSEATQECLLLPLLFNIVWEILARAI